ncbi:MAG TPA: IS5 family transposase [Candidatus Sulfotelmatobacter sp.]|nr:IS5 family transposase [Candidatus Sulfotelmatobacter sp.]HWI58648.1 IS5 family transposase [Bacillota bacterium]
MQKSCLYPTDLTDAQWEILEPLLPKPKKRGRRPADRRRILNGLFYLVRAGCAWRLLPKEFGPWETVYGYFRCWRQQGLWVLIQDILRSFVRREAGKRSQPTAAILDSQTVRSANHAGERGYDAAKKTKGRKRHILVDTLGLLLWVCVTPADVSEKGGARKFLSRALRWFGWLRCIWADAGYTGAPFADWVAAHRKTGTLRLEIVSRLQGQRGFQVLAKRWIVERTFGWFMKHRRLVRDYETRLDHAEAMIHITMIGVMLRRLA